MEVSRMGVRRGDLRVQSWNCNSLKKKQKSWLQFISKLKNSNENAFILVDTRFGPQQEKDFEKLWDWPVFFSIPLTVTKGDLWCCLGIPYQLKM